jgi:3-oxoacyl-[acyl-carrier protein] reductase
MTWQRLHQLARPLGKSDDVAQLVAFLATSEPCLITGQDFVIDGFQYNV